MSTDADLLTDVELPEADEPVGPLSDRFTEPAERLPVRRDVVTDDDLGTLIPLQQELRGMAQIAVTLAAANVLPAALRRKPEDVLAIILTGRELGVGPMTAIRNFHVIDGTVTIAPKFKVAQVHKRGLGRVYPHQPPRTTTDAETGEQRRVQCACGMDDAANGPEQAMWHAERVDTPGIIYTSRFTVEDAARITFPKWEGPEGKRTKRDVPITDKDNWRNYPQRMLSWRALGYLIDDAFAEIGTGLYMPDELGAVTDEDGLPVLDVKSSESLVAGPKAKPSPPVQPDVLADFKRRIDGLREYPEVLAELLAAYKARALPPKLDDLLYADQRVMEALIVAAEQKAKAQVRDEAPPQPEAPADAAPEPTQHEQDVATMEAYRADRAPAVTPASTEAPADGPEAAAPSPPAVPPPFDTDGLPVERGADADAAWAERAPDAWISETIDEVTALPTNEVRLRAKAFGYPRGSESTLRAALTAALLRHRMEKAVRP